MNNRSKLSEVVRRILQELDEQKALYCLVGGFAVSLRGEPRLTRDIDLAVAVSSDAEAKNLIHFLQQKSFIVETVLEQGATGRLSTARLRPPKIIESDFLLDLLFASSGIEPEIVASSESMEIFREVTCKVALRPHLIAMKVLAVDERLRPHDAEDLLSMLRLAAPEELETVYSLLRLIHERGFARKRDLEGILEDFRSRLR